MTARRVTRRSVKKPPSRPTPRDFYLYGIVNWPLEFDVGSPGPGAGEAAGRVHLVRHRKIAALVGEVSATQSTQSTQPDLRAMRREMRSHSRILQQVAQETTVLPVRFGVIVSGESALRSRLLEPRYRQLVQALAQLKGTVEISLKATYQELEILAEVTAARPELRGHPSATARGGSMAYEARLELGRNIAAAIDQTRQRDARWIVAAFSPVARDVRLNRASSDMTVVNASFLLDRTKLPRFDRRLDQVAAEVGSLMKLDCIGPLPVYSFVDLRV